MTGFILLFLAMFCQNPNHTTVKHSSNTTQVSTLDDDGDTGHVPPKPPPPPPNP